MKEYILYHKGCDDGFGAAYAAWKALGEDATYIPCAYGEPPPEMTYGAKVTLVDFSYKREVLLELRKNYPDLMVIDHHKTAQEDLDGLDYAHFDMEHSGAVLAWYHWHGWALMPKLLEYVEDRDLWKKELPESDEFTAGLRSFEQDFEVWDMLAKGNGFQMLIQDGRAILRYIQNQVDYIVNLKARWGKILGHHIPLVNSPVFQSEIAHKLCEIEPSAPFAAVYHDRKDGLREFSLRSLPDFDVSEVAKAMGGGGHENAAGFTVKGEFHKDIYLQLDPDGPAHGV